MKKRLLFLFFLVNVLFTSLARCAKRSNRKRSRKSSLRKDLRQIKKDVAELKDDHETMLVMMESMNKNVSEIGSGFGSSEEIPEGYYLVDDMVLPCSDLDPDQFYEYEIPIPPTCKEELREKKKKGRKGSKRKVKNKKGKKTKGKKIKGKKTKSKKKTKAKIATGKKTKGKRTKANA